MDRLVDAAVNSGALGAKLSGAGRGGNMIALVQPEDADRISVALQKAGATRIIKRGSGLFQTLEIISMLYFLKLGGSLITDKNQALQPRRDVLERLSREIAEAYRVNPDLRLIIGHGSGSFGHVAGQKYSTRQGVHSKEDWQGFVEVWKDARVFNQIVVEALLEAGLPVIAFPTLSISNFKHTTSTSPGIWSQFDWHCRLG